MTKKLKNLENQKKFKRFHPKNLNRWQAFQNRYLIIRKDKFYSNYKRPTEVIKDFRWIKDLQMM